MGVMMFGIKAFRIVAAAGAILTLLTTVGCAGQGASTIGSLKADLDSVGVFCSVGSQANGEGETLFCNGFDGKAASVVIYVYADLEDMKGDSDFTSQCFQWNGPFVGGNYWYLTGGWDVTLSELDLSKYAIALGVDLSDIRNHPACKP